MLKQHTVKILLLYSYRNKYRRLSECVQLKIYLGNTSECIYFAVVFTARYFISKHTPLVKYGLVSKEIEILSMFCNDTLGVIFVVNMDQILLDIFNFQEAISESMGSTSLKGNGTATGAHIRFNAR